MEPPDTATNPVKIYTSPVLDDINLFSLYLNGFRPDNTGVSPSGSIEFITGRSGYNSFTSPKNHTQRLCRGCIMSEHMVILPLRKRLDYNTKLQ